MLCRIPDMVKTSEFNLQAGMPRFPAIVGPDESIIAPKGSRERIVHKFLLDQCLKNDDEDYKIYVEIRKLYDSIQIQKTPKSVDLEDINSYINFLNTKFPNRKERPDEMKEVYRFLKSLQTKLTRMASLHKPVKAA